MSNSKYSEYKIGDKLVIVARNKQGTDRRAAVVFDIDYRGNGLVTYCGDYTREGMMPSGQGAFNPAALPSNAPFGICVDVERV